MAVSKSTVLRELVTTARGERVRTHRVTSPTGEVISIEPTQTALPYRFGADDVTRFDLRAFARACDAAAEVLTDADRPAFDELMARKRNEFDARRRNR
jgi:hypothetical protein